MGNKQIILKKAIACLSSAVIAAAALTCLPLSAAADDAPAGDFTGNGFLDAADLSAMKQGILSGNKDSGFQKTGDKFSDDISSRTEELR